MILMDAVVPQLAVGMRPHAKTHAGGGACRVRGLELVQQLVAVVHGGVVRSRDMRVGGRLDAHPRHRLERFGCELPDQPGPVLCGRSSSERWANVRANCVPTVTWQALSSACPPSAGPVLLAPCSW